jgi:putative phosphoribosyl transferase
MFVDRSQAGRRLAEELERFRGEGAVVLGLPRGGVPVAYEVACRLGAPLDVIVVRKLGVPYQPELAMGSIGEGGVRIINREVVAATGVTDEQLGRVDQREREELSRQAEFLRAGRPYVPLVDRTAIVVDDGIATGSTARAACLAAQARGAARVVISTPVAARSAVAGLRADADEIVCLETPDYFWAVGQWYADFAQTPDEEVLELLDRSLRR